MPKDSKNINIEINIMCWKKLKKLSIDKDMSLQDVIREILEKVSSSKKFDIEES